MRCFQCINGPVRLPDPALHTGRPGLPGPEPRPGPGLHHSEVNSDILGRYEQPITRTALIKLLRLSWGRCRRPLRARRGPGSESRAGLGPGLGPGCCRSGDPRAWIHHQICGRFHTTVPFEGQSGPPLLERVSHLCVLGARFLKLCLIVSKFYVNIVQVFS